LRHKPLPLLTAGTVPPSVSFNKMKIIKARRELSSDVETHDI
jgi:hypothetical protein